MPNDKYDDDDNDDDDSGYNDNDDDTIAQFPLPHSHWLHSNTKCYSTL